MKRSYEKEIMDDFSIQNEDIDNALRELDIINTLSFGNFLSSAAIKKIKRKYRLSKLKILDAGGGSSKFLKHKFIHDEIVNVDLNIRATEFSNQVNNVLSINADAFLLPIKDKALDVTHCSLFLHHFTENEIKKLILHLKEKTKYAIVINDIHRSFIAYYFIKITTKVFSKSYMVKHDGPLSMKRGFKLAELKSILNSLNLKYSIYWLMYRWLIIIDVK